MSSTPQPDPSGNPQYGSEGFTQPQPHAFCQICGRAVAHEADRLAGNAYPCGLCNEVKLASPASTGYVYPGPEAGVGAGAPPPFTGGPFPPPPPGVAVSGAPNPALAALLGFIPGVGAMYNGQYAKGIVHLIVFAILVNLTDFNGIFGLFIAGWIFYQVIEAHHTARARRDGTMLPNPFGLNDIGEKLGFGKAWPSYPGNQAAGTQAQGAPFGAVPPVAAGYRAPSSNWGAPWESYRTAAPPVPPFTPPPVPPYAPPYVPVSAGFDGPPPFDPARTGFEPPYPVAGSRFPAGAIWLIGLGTLFLLNTSGIFREVNFHFILPVFFIGLGIWQFVQKMTRGGYGLADDGSAEYRLRLFRAARSGVWLILLGVIFFLADFHILPWSRSWPLFLILGGVMMFLERAVYRVAAPLPYGYPPQPSSAAGPGSPVAPPYSPGTAMTVAEGTEHTIDTTTNTTEGR